MSVILFSGTRQYCTEEFRSQRWGHEGYSNWLPVCEIQAVSTAVGCYFWTFFFFQTEQAGSAVTLQTCTRVEPQPEHNASWQLRVSPQSVHANNGIRASLDGNRLLPNPFQLIYNANNLTSWWWQYRKPNQKKYSIEYFMIFIPCDFLAADLPA
jgi:hypothetical protein